MPGVRTWHATHNGSMHFSYTHPYASTRLPVFARNVVSTSHPLAAQAGLRMLQQGGNAVDAAVAAAAAMTICEPVSNGLGSDAFCILWDGQALHGLNASGRAPAAWTPGYFHSRYGMSPASPPKRGIDSVTVPGAVSAWVALSERFGKLPFAALMEPAAEIAERGYLVPVVVQQKWAAAVPELQSQPGFARSFMPWGRAPQVGELFQFAAAARALRAIGATQGQAFYTGEIAQALVAFSQAQGGSLTLAAPLLSNVQGEIYAGTIDATAATLNNQQGVIAAQQLVLSGNALDNRGGSIGAFSAAGKNLTLNFSQAIDNSAQGIIQSAADVAVITSQQLDNTAGNIVLAGSNGSLQLSAATLQNQQGQIQTNGQLLLAADNVNNQAGYIAAVSDVSITAAGVNNSAGQILADKLLLSTEQLTNTDGMILVQNELNLHSPLLANLRGVISAQTLNITGNTLDNTGGQLLAATELNINTGQLTNLDGVINSQQTLQLSAAELNNRSGVIQGVNSFNAQVQGSTDHHSGQLLACALLEEVFRQAPRCGHTSGGRQH